MFQSIPVIPVIPGPTQHFPQGNKVRVQRVQRVQAEKLKRQIAQAVPTVNRCEQMWTGDGNSWNLWILMEHEHLTFRVAYVSWLLWLLYGFYTAFIRLLASSPFGIVLARWFLRLLGFCSFLLLTLYACFSARNWHMISTSVLTGPFSSPENRISGHLLKFVLQPYLKENHVKIDEHHRKKWGKTM